MSIHKSILILLTLMCWFSGYAQTNQYANFKSLDFEGSAVVDELYSPSLEGNLQGNPATQPVKIYLPPGYDNFPENRYPVIYLLHPYTHDYAFYDSYNLLSTLNEMMAEKTIMPMIVVTPNGWTIYDGSLYTNSYVSGNWEDFIVQDVVNFIESNYHVIEKQSSRGLSGFSMGAYGTAILGMKHYDRFSALGIIGGPMLDLEALYLNPPYREYMIEAATINDYREGDPWYVHASYAEAVAFAPDSAIKPIPGGLPYTPDSLLVDSIWQEWLQHDPSALLQLNKDSLIKYSTIQMYIGENDDLLPNNEVFHQTLLNNGIEHGYEKYSGGHDPGPVLSDLLRFFSENLVNDVPMIHTSSEYYLEPTDTLKIITNKDSEVIVVPSSAGYELDSIYKYQVVTADALANEVCDAPLSDIEFGKYWVFAEGENGMVSNFPEEFYVVPSTLPPDLNLVKDTVISGDSIAVSMNRNGSVFLMNTFWGMIDTLHTEAAILDSPTLIEKLDVVADEIVGFSFRDPEAHGLPYVVYGIDSYGIVSVPKKVQVMPVGIKTIERLKVEIYPNPITDLVTLQFTKPDNYNIEISSLNGQLMFSKELGGSTHQLDLSSFEKGVYLITIRSRDHVTTRKIVKL